MVVGAGVGGLVVAMCAFLRRAGSSPSLSAGLSWEKGERTRGGGSGKGGGARHRPNSPICGDVLCEPACDGLVPGLMSKALPHEVHCTAAQTGFGPIRVPDVLGPLRSYRRATAKPSGNA